MFIFVLLTIATGLAQEAAKPKFEVASVRRVDPSDQDETAFIRGGPGTDDPERIMYHHVSLVRLLVLGYGVDFDQVFGPASLGSEWLGQELYDITAKIPLGTTQDQLRFMWQDLLAERFHLKAHMGRRPFSLYELSVAKGGVKFKTAATVRAALEPGYPELAPGVKYDFKLDFTGEWGPGGALLPPLPDGQLDSAPTFFDAIREQLGLTLVEKKGLLDVVVVDRVDRIPVEN